MIKEHKGYFVSLQNNNMRQNFLNSEKGTLFYLRPMGVKKQIHKSNLF